jgi:hypothetical protein
MSSPSTDRRLGLAGGQAYKVPVTVIATANITQSGEQTIDGIAVKAVNTSGVPDRVLCTGMTDATKNGLWDVQTSAWTRSIDADGNYDFAQGTQVIIARGSAAFQIWTLTTATPIIIGTTPQTWSQSLSAGFLATLAAPGGAGLSGYTGSVNYASRTIGARLIDVGASPRSFGATGDGVADDTSYITTAFLYSKTLDLRNRAWNITSTINLPSGCTILMDGASIVAACGATPVFNFIGANAGLTIYHGGSGAVTGTASTFLFCQGSTNQPTLFSQYASLINIYGLRISSATITNALTFDKAVNSVTLRGVNFYTPNGINASGANVAVMISDSIIYSATGLAGTYGIKLRSTGGTSYFNQGWQIVNSTIDNFEISHDISDVFAYTVTGGYHGCNATLSPTTGYAFQFQAPTNTTLTDTITIGGGTVIAGRTRFVGSAGGQAYNADIDGLWINVPGTAVALENNAAAVNIKGRFKAGSGTAIAVVGSSNNAAISTDVEVDSTYTNGVVLNGASGANCEVRARGPCAGDIVGAGRSNIRYLAVPIHSSGVAAFNRVSSASNLGAGATYAVAATISSLAVGFARGETGDLVVHLPYSGANAATQNLQFTLPAGMVVASGTGWSATNLFLGAAAGLVSVRIPYYCTADGSGNVVLANQAGNTLTVANQGYCSVVRDW